MNNQQEVIKRQEMQIAYLMDQKVSSEASQQTIPKSQVNATIDLKSPHS